MFWAVIKCNLRDPSEAKKFNAWYNEQHAPRYVAQPGFRRGWRLERLDREGQRGDPGQRYLAIYEIDAVADFNAALDRDLAESHPWEEWEDKVADWQRTYYRTLLSFGSPNATGAGDDGYWTIVRVDFAGLNDSQERAFNAWYDKQHVPEIGSFPGFHRAWRLKLEPDANDLGARGQKYMAIYETDQPDYLPRVRRGKTPWDGIWGDYVSNWQVGFYRKLFDREKQARTDG